MYNVAHKPGKHKLELCTCLSCHVCGTYRLRDYIKTKLGISHGETTPDGAFSLESVPCIGLSDQAPAALINDVPVTNLTSDAAHDIVEELRAHGDPQKLVMSFGDGNNARSGRMAGCTATAPAAAIPQIARI